jgi:NAD(P)-dependent dehydrogenase (short-subunit alcohol dehydrogenase family)
LSNFAGKVAFVTGAGGGMGFQIASDLINAGASVLMFDIKPEPEDIPGSPEQSLYVQADLTDEPVVVAAVEKAVELFGGVDLLANVAGALWFDRDKTALEIDLDVWDQVMAVAVVPWCIFRRRNVCAVIRRPRTPTRPPRPVWWRFPSRLQFNWQAKTFAPT